MLKIRSWASFLFLFLSILICNPSTVTSAEAPLSTAPAPVPHITEIKAEITKVSGSVVVRSRGTVFWHDAKTGEFLRTGDIVQTKENGKIEFRLGNGNVIKLKPDSRLMIRKLTQNNLTGDYENFFESDKGNIWCKIEKIKGKSSFEVKTPTATAGARGTIIYLVVFPDSTLALFEEGRGFLENDLSGASYEVEPGNVYQLDENGNIVGTLDPTSQTYQDITQGWDFNSGSGEGYSPPGDNGGEGGDDDNDDDGDEGDDNLGDGGNNPGGGGDGGPNPIDNPQGPGGNSSIDTDGDGIEDSIDTDDDNDGYLDTADDFPLDKNEWLDTDDDGTGNNADTDDDDDSVPDVDETTRGTDSLLGDTDNDGITDDDELNTDGTGLIDDYDTDDDDDGCIDTIDMYPLDASEQTDTDGDGIGNNADEDDDNDEYADEEDAFPLNKREHEDSDEDGMGDNIESAWWWVYSDAYIQDTDNDGIYDCDDAFPDDASRTETRDEMRAKIKEALAANDLRREVAYMVAETQTRHIDSVMEQISDAQTGKVLINRNGYRVRTEQYVLRPNSTTVEVLNLTLQTDPAMAGLHSLDWKTTFNTSIDGLCGDGLRNLPWETYLQSTVDADGKIIGGPAYVSEIPPEYYPVQMTLKTEGPGSGAFNDRRLFGALYSSEGGWRQDINEQIYLDGAWRDFHVTTGMTSGKGNPNGFIYNPDGMPSAWNIRAKFYVIGDADAGLQTGMEGLHFDTIWDAMAANMYKNLYIGANNLEISLESKFGGSYNKTVDFIYIPWHNQHWHDREE